MTPSDVRHHFAGYRFGEPCTADDLARAEAALGQPIPPILRELYLSFDGFAGPTNAAFFWPLFAKKRGTGALVEMNRFFRDDDLFPRELVSQTLFYGDPGIGPAWGLKADLPGKIIIWDASWEDFEIAGTDMLEVWLEEKRKYDDLASGDQR